jgi:DNA invertase Pin-like site-specific DNA recombinase
MNQTGKITSQHLDRQAIVYVRQSTAGQVEHHRESTDRQYALARCAERLGWPSARILVIDEDLGLTGASAGHRSGFARLTAEVAMGRVGLVLGLEVSRLARNNADWYRLLDLCSMTDTLIGDADDVYHPGGFNDRLVLGLKGTMSEAELHILRARLDGGIRNKAARGELRRALPIGYVCGERAGEMRFDPNAAITGAIRRVFELFTALGSARRVWIALRDESLPFPLRPEPHGEVRWGAPTYTAVHRILVNPVYAGAYIYGRTRQERHIDVHGMPRRRSRRLPEREWSIVLKDHHPGFIDWETYEINRARIGSNTRPQRHNAGGAVREGAALLQGLGRCGHCGRRLRVYYRTAGGPGYYCSGQHITNGRGVACLNIGGRQIDAAITQALLAAVTPAAVAAAQEAAECLDATDAAALGQRRRDVERHRHEARVAERRYRAVDPENRLVARGLEAEWEQSLTQLQIAEAELARRERQWRSRTPIDQAALAALAADLQRVWDNAATTPRDRKALLRTLIEEVTISVDRAERCATLAIHWCSGAGTAMLIDLPRTRQAANRTDEGTIDLIRRLVAHHSDAVTAGILNQQGHRTARGQHFTAVTIASLRRSHSISRPKAEDAAPGMPVLSVRAAARRLGTKPPTLLRWVKAGLIMGEQVTPGAPWRIRLTPELESRFVDALLPGFLPVGQVVQRLGSSRETVLQQIRHGELEALHLRGGRGKGLYIRPMRDQPTLFEHFAQ